ncbi:hypothetical protein C0995_004595, partial [Termitomyces sp. Mi166
HMINHSNLSDKEVNEAEQENEDDKDNEYASEYKYKKIEVDDNMKMCHLKKAHNEKVDWKKDMDQK